MSRSNPFVLMERPILSKEYCARQALEYAAQLVRGLTLHFLERSESGILGFHGHPGVLPGDREIIFSERVLSSLKVVAG